jgi:hypothetical protein
LVLGVSSFCSFTHYGLPRSMNAMKFQQSSPAIYAEFVCAMTMTMLHLDSHEQ